MPRLLGAADRAMIRGEAAREATPTRGALTGNAMTNSFTRRSAAAALAATTLALAGCAIAPTGVPTAESIRGLKPSGTVTMN